MYSSSASSVRLPDAGAETLLGLFVGGFGLLDAARPFEGMGTLAGAAGAGEEAALCLEEWVAR